MACLFHVPSRRTLLLALLIALGGNHSAMASNTPQSVASAFRSLTWEQVKFVIDRDPGMKRAYDEAGPVLQGLMQSNPSGFPWDNVTRNRDQATLDRIGGLIAQARGGSAPSVPPPSPALPAGSVITAEPRTDGGVYMVDAAGAKRHIASPEVFNGCGLDWGRIQKLPPATVNGMATGAVLRTAQECRTLLMASQATLTPQQARQQAQQEAQQRAQQQTQQQQQPQQVQQTPQQQAPAQAMPQAPAAIDLSARVPAACNTPLTTAVDNYQLEPAGVAGLFMRMNRQQMADVLELAKGGLFWTPKAMQRVLQDKVHDLEPEARCASMIDIARRERGGYPGAELNRLLRLVADYNAKLSGTPVAGNEIRATRIHDGAPQPCMIQPAADPKLKAGQCHQLSMSGVNLAGRDLTRMAFTNSVLTRANFSGAKLAYSGFTGSDLSGADFSNADLTGANLANTKAEGAKFAGAKLGRVKGFPGTPAGHVCASDSVGTCKPVREINGCVIEPGVLDPSRGRAQPGSDCSYADLRNADLRNADLTMMKFERANLAGADLSGAKLFGANLAEANLAGAKIGGARFEDANLFHAAWVDGKFCSKTSTKGKCEPVSRVGDCWIEPDTDCRPVGGLANGNFTGLNLAGVNLEGVDLSRANFSNADISEANLFKAKLDGASFHGAKVRADGAACARGTPGGPVCVLGDGSRVTIGVDVANGGKREATVLAAPPGGRIIHVHNMCQEPRGISVKNGLSIAAGDYLDVAGPGQKNLVIPSGGVVRLPAPGKQHRVHFQGNFVAGIDLRNDADQVYIRPGSCDMIVGNPATIGPQLAQTGRPQVVTIINQCVREESLAIKNDETGEYQKIGSDAKTPTDLKVVPNASTTVSPFGRQFWAHFSGNVPAGIKFEGSGQLFIERGGAPCRLRFVQGPAPAEGGFRITRLRNPNDGAIAQNFARMVEAATYGRATPEEMMQINDFLAYASRARVQAADIALAGLKSWREMTKEHNPRCVDRKATALQSRDYTPQQAAAEGFTIPFTFDGKEKFCRFEPRYTVGVNQRPTNVNLGMLFNANNETGEVTPPDDYLNLAMAGVPIRTAADSAELNKALAAAGAAVGGIVVAGAGAAAIGPVAVAITMQVAPWALHGLGTAAMPIGSAAAASAAGSIAAGAVFVPAIAASVVIAIAAPMLMDIIKNMEYEPKIHELRRSYVAVPYTLDALRTSDGRYALFTHYVRYAKGAR